MSFKMDKPHSLPAMTEEDAPKWEKNSQKLNERGPFEPQALTVWSRKRTIKDVLTLAKVGAAVNFY